MIDDSQDRDPIEEALRRVAARLPSLQYDPARGRALSERDELEVFDVTIAREAAHETSAEVGWRRVAGDAPVEPRHAWAPVPSEILEVAHGTVDRQISVEPNGTPDELTGATLRLDVFGVMPGRLVLVDSTGSERAMKRIGDALVGEVPAVSMSLASEDDGLPVYELVVRLRWYEE